MKYIALLRGINVGGHRLIKMEDLRTFFEAMGFQKVQTYIQSGNVIFDTAKSDVKTLRNAIEEKLLQFCGFAVDVYLRSESEFAAVVRNSPFMMTAPEHQVYVAFLSEAPDSALQTALDAYNRDIEQFHLNGSELFVFCVKDKTHKRGGDHRFSDAFIKKTLGVQATTRNWATVTKLQRLLTE